ncbi:hypothetical protein WP4S18C04_P10530 (plasmid) [Klebsiella pneumoniae]|uniref:hypothetical protein n=1 Tax=Klebsiella pneumoniae TaxID=573 RepID=UPI0015DCF594|nr:hypothetical protein [Klebsiella pneumoniae]BBR80467.1 hypothetical protein WP4S18C04_P10530 [Klebsiella pneumoniae]
MSTSTIEALASAWARIAEEAEFPADYEGTATPQAHRASEAIQEQIRERIVATNDMRLFSLLHLLGQASLRMEQALWPEDYERMTRGHCCKVSDEAAFCLIQRPYISKTLLTRRISPRGSP